MSDENAVVTADTNTPVSDEQVSKFFETGGDDAAIEVVKEPVEETKAAEPEKPKREEYVPHAALHEERQLRKEIKKLYDEQQKELAELRARLTPKQEEPQVPAIDQDPVGYFQAQNAKLERELAELKGMTTEQRQQAEQQRQWNGFVSAYQSAAKEFSNANPDFAAAYNHAIQARVNQFVAAGFSLEQAQHTANQEETAIVSKAFQDGVNPASRVYEWGKALGYQKAPLQDAQKMAALEKGVQAKSLGSSGTAPEPDSLEALVKIEDEEEFDKAWARFAKKQRGR